MAVLGFIFGSFWRFCGVLVLLSAIGGIINACIQAILDARSKGKRTIRIVEKWDETTIWIEYPTDSDIDKVLKAKLAASEAGSEADKKEWEGWEF